MIAARRSALARLRHPAGAGALAARLAFVAAAFWTAALVTGCAAGAAQRRAYLDAHPEIDARTRALIAEGRIERGMSLEQVRATLGPPDSRRAFEEEGAILEVWTYPGALVKRQITRTATDLDYRSRLVFRDGVLEGIEDL